MGAKYVDRCLGFGARLRIPGRHQLLERPAQRLGSNVREGSQLVAVDEQTKCSTRHTGADRDRPFDEFSCALLVLGSATRLLQRRENDGRQHVLWPVRC